MTSTGVNVLRWSALGLGVVYGVYRQSAISAADKLKANMAEYEHKQTLINQAKSEYQKLNAPKDIITDPEDPKFDLEAALSQWAKQ
ncbi:hypothetical protein MBLNU459_g5487t1 [Dothideomycetes sp. NU459]